MKISRIIQEICDEQNVDYKSQHLLDNINGSDIVALKRVYRKLESIKGDLKDIENRHLSVSDFKNAIDEAITLLGKIEHDDIQRAINDLKKE